MGWRDQARVERAQNAKWTEAPAATASSAAKSRSEYRSAATAAVAAAAVRQEAQHPSLHVGEEIQDESPAALTLAALEAAGHSVRLDMENPEAFRIKPGAGGDLALDALRYGREILELLRYRVSPSTARASLGAGWTRNPDGTWEFPAGWARLYPRLPDGREAAWEGIEAVADATRLALPADEPRPVLRPLAAHERAAVRAGPLPTGVSYGHTSPGQWRRLT